jgi:hypothetical protein
MRKASIKIGVRWEEITILSITPQGSRYIIIYEIHSSVNPQRFETYNLTDIELIW